MVVVEQITKETYSIDEILSGKKVKFRIVYEAKGNEERISVDGYVEDSATFSNPEENLEFIALFTKRDGVDYGGWSGIPGRSPLKNGNAVEGIHDFLKGKLPEYLTRKMYKIGRAHV